MITNDSLATARSDLDPEPKTVLDEAIVAALIRAGQSTIGLTELAQQTTSSDWHAHLPTVRRVVFALAAAGRVVLYRKGKPIDPQDARGVIRIGLPRQD